MKSLFNVYKLNGDFVGYAWASTPSDAIELVTGKQAQDYAHVALGPFGGNTQSSDELAKSP
jgi:hypothetical protein